MEKLKTKNAVKILSVSLILLLTASAASAAYSCQSGKYYSNNYNYKNYTNSEWNYNHSYYNQYSRITSYNVCYTKLLRDNLVPILQGDYRNCCNSFFPYRLGHVFGVKIQGVNGFFGPDLFCFV